MRGGVDHRDGLPQGEAKGADEPDLSVIEVLEASVPEAGSDCELSLLLLDGLGIELES
jgi:hypothetical protein